MTVLLVPTDGDMVMSTEHLGVAYLASVLRKEGFPCRIVEIGGCRTAAAVEELSSLNPRLLGITLTTISVPRATALGAQLRSVMPDCHITCGGPLPTFRGGDLLNLDGWQFLDSLVRGEGERPLLELARALYERRSLELVPSLCYRAKGGVKCNPLCTPEMDLDNLPWPSRDQYELNPKAAEYLRISTSRGCTSHCTFCNAPHAGNQIINTKVWRGRSPRNVVDEIEHLYRRYGFNTFDFVDSTFEDPGGTPAAKARIAEIADLLMSRGLEIYYNCCMQAKNWSDGDRPLLTKLYRSGLEKVLVGIESGSEQGLRLWKKPSNTSHNAQVIRLLREQDIYVAFGFIMFHPYSTEAEILDNAEFLHRYLGHNLRRFFTRLELYAGAEIIRQLETDKLLTPEFHHSMRIYAYRFKDETIERMSNMAARLFGESYARFGFVEHEPAVFAFETYDIVLHTFFCRLRRRGLNNRCAQEIVQECAREIDSVKSEMAAFNYSLFHELLGQARRDQPAEGIAALQREVETYYQNKMNTMRSLQLRASWALRRNGVDIRDYVSSHPVGVSA